MLLENFTYPPPRDFQLGFPFTWAPAAIGRLRNLASDALNPLVAFFKGVDFIEMDEEGNPRLAARRLLKMQREIDDFLKAEQYALKAGFDNHYPCYSCPNSPTIFLWVMQIWKYGTTTKGEKGRYKKSLIGTGLVYVAELEDEYQPCLAEEKRKLYCYALLPENLARLIPLIRPPGYKVDR